MKNKFNLDTVFKIIWVSLCLLWCGWFLVKVLDTTYLVWEKIFFAAGILVILMYIFLRTEENNRKEILAHTIQHYKCDKKYIKGEYARNSYELYLSSASNHYMYSEFSKILQDGIIDSRTKFKQEDAISSLYSLYIFKKEILKNWGKYENSLLKIPCFIGEWDILSALPICFSCDVTVEGEYYESSDFDFSIRFNKTKDENDPLNKYYLGTLDSDEDTNIRKFVNVYGYLQKDEYDNLLLINCRSELADFQAYRQEIAHKK